MNARNTSPFLTIGFQEELDMLIVDYLHETDWSLRITDESVIA